MPKHAFLPPLINPWVVAGVRALFPFGLKTLMGGLSVEISQEDLEKLRQYQGKRMLLLPNHPNGDEPVVLFEVSKRLNEIFNFVAAREVFDWEHGFRGWLIRRCGAYSIIRGAADRDSFLMSKKILMEGQHRLMIFIEGEISRGNEVLIPYEPGVLQLGFWAQEGLAKEAQKRAIRTGSPPDDYPPIYLAPLAIKYFYHPGAESVMAKSIQALENAVGIIPSPGRSNYQRIQAIGESVLKVQETLHQVTSTPDMSVTERVTAIQYRMLQKMELFLDLQPTPEATALSRLREIRNTMDLLIHSYDDPLELSHYEKRVVEHLRLALSEFYTDLERIVYFITYDEHYLQESQTPERTIDVIRRLEKEVFGNAKLIYPRVAVVRVGSTRNLKAHFAQYEANKKEYTQQLATELENETLDLLIHTSSPIQTDEYK